MSESKLRTILISALVVLSAVIVAGLLWFFVGATGAPTGLGWYVFSFASGLTMIVLPCTLPLAFVVVPLVMKKGLVKGIGIALAFGIGVAFTLSMYGIAAAVVGKVAIGALEAPLELVKNWVYFTAGIFALAFALGEIGLIKVRMPSYTGAAPAFIQKRGDYFKALLLGLFLGNIGVGCPHPATPLLLIEIASSGNILYGWSLFLIHAIGRVLPLLFLAMLALLGVNGLSWLVTRKDAIERATGWAMVFVAGFILTLGLFTHDWYVNSGVHTWFETLTQEARFTGIIAENLDSDVVHSHGIEDGPGLFGLPLWLGNWTLVFLWVFPIWWWWARKRKELYGSTAMRMERLQAQIDKLETGRRLIEAEAKLEDLTPTTAINDIQKQIDALEQERRKAEEAVQYGERGALANPLARQYEKTVIFGKRNFIIVLTLLLALVFVYVLPHNFLEHSALEHGHSSPDPQPADVAFSRETAGLPTAREPEIVELNDGAVYAIAATVVKKEIGNRTVKMLGYNGMIPGPFLKVPQGAEITINFTNNTDVPTTIHSHGIRLDNRFDGTPDVTQYPVGIGETFSYKVRFPDAGTYWYHPHIREDYAQELGLYGNYIVEPTDPKYWSPVNREVPLLIDDILITSENIEPFYEETVNFALLGRFGNEFLVNGEPNFVMNIQKGEVVRLPITNAANARTFNLSIPGARVKMVAADAGKFEREEFANSFLISPSERAVIEVHFERPGIYKLVNTTPDGTDEFAYFSVSDESVETSYATSFATLRTNSDVIEEFRAIASQFARPIDKELLLTVEMGMGEDDHSAHAHTMGGSGANGMQWHDPTQSDRVNTSKTVTWKIVDRQTGKANMDIDWRFRVGEYAKVRIENDPNAHHVMQHPIHFHGQRFVIISRNDKPERNRAWKDTALVLPGETLEILVEMSNPGVWMAHCHIAEHLHTGMMFGFRVETSDGSAPGDDYRTQTGSSFAIPGSTISENAVVSGLRVRYVTSASETIVAGAPATLRFALENMADGTAQSASAFAESGALRVFGVSEQGDDSFVLYPAQTTAGVFSAPHRFLNGGTYYLWSVLEENGRIKRFSHPSLIVQGENGTAPTPSFTNNRIIGNYQVALAHESLKPGVPATAEIVITDVFGGGVALEPIQGDGLQIDMVGPGFTTYFHEHPEVIEPEDIAENASTDGEPLPSTAPAPADDGHDHQHSMNMLIPVAHAHGEIIGAIPASTVQRLTLSFPREGTYRLFVRFRPTESGLPDGRTLTAIFDLSVPSEGVGTLLGAEASRTGAALWYSSGRWWTFLLVSLVLMAGLSLWVKRYLEKE